MTIDERNELRQKCEKAIAGVDYGEPVRYGWVRIEPEKLVELLDLADLVDAPLIAARRQRREAVNAAKRAAPARPDGS